ncbi:hypothetical protein D3C80_479650 [compost metagenome]
MLDAGELHLRHHAGNHKRQHTACHQPYACAQRFFIASMICTCSGRWASEGQEHHQHQAVRHRLIERIFQVHVERQWQQGRQTAPPTAASSPQPFKNARDHEQNACHRDQAAFHPGIQKLVMRIQNRRAAHTRRNLLRQLPKQRFKTAVTVADERVVQNQLPCQCDQIPALHIRAILLYQLRNKARHHKRPVVQREHTRASARHQ